MIDPGTEIDARYRVPAVVGDQTGTTDERLFLTKRFGVGATIGLEVQLR